MLHCWCTWTKCFTLEGKKLNEHTDFSQQFFRTRFSSSPNINSQSCILSKKFNYINLAVMIYRINYTYYQLYNVYGMLKKISFHQLHKKETPHITCSSQRLSQLLVLRAVSHRELKDTLFQILWNHTSTVMDFHVNNLQSSEPNHH